MEESIDIFAWKKKVSYPGMLRIIGFFVLVFMSVSCRGNNEGKIRTGAEQPDKYLPLLRNKKTGLVVNHSSIIGEIHLVDFLLEQDVEVKRIFAPEHGFRGNVQAGEMIENGMDKKSNIPVVSLYGNNMKPLPVHLKDIDIVVFDIQDVGCRFYTYISTLHLVLEACAGNGIVLVVLDRPNPNGNYIAGPVLEPGFKSFVGMNQVPVVHGCTTGEFARMINGESWHQAPQKCDLIVIPVKNYDHKKSYSLPVAPSPNLPNDLSVRLYPSLCFFEATSVSIGRGTEFPFQVIGGINPLLGHFKFIPRSIPGVADNPLNEGKVCYGVDLRRLHEVPEFTLKYFLGFYHMFENEEDFLTREHWFNLLAGNDTLIRKIRQGFSLKEIEDSWLPGLEKYKKVRKKYLLYPDFE